MKSVRKLLFSLFFVCMALFMSSWGFLVHKTVHQLAVYELPKSMRPFFYQNMRQLVYDAPRPDLRRSKDSTEATKHFIDLEAFGPDAAHSMPMSWNEAVQKYGEDSLLEYGYVPYHILYLKDKLTNAFRLKDKDSILFFAADIGHYIADANVPLHTTINYDGQLSNQPGLHALWETVVPEIEIANYTLYSKHRASYLKKPEQAIWDAVRRSAALLPDVFEKEKSVSMQFTESQKYRVQLRRGKQTKYYTSEFAKAYALALKNSINDQLIHSADLIADFYYTAWVDAGRPDLSEIITGNAAFGKKQLKAELKSFRKNRLLPNKLLIARNDAINEGN